MIDERPILQDWFYIKKKFVPEQFYRDLTLYLPDETNPENIIDYPVYTETIDNNGETYISFPRYCTYGQRILNQKIQIYNDLTTIGEDIQINMKVNPRDDFQEKAICAIVSMNHGICQAKTGAGKTYMAIASIARIKKKAMVFVHKTALAEQWKEDILNYTDLKEDDIEILKGTKYDLNKKIIITTVQNFATKTSKGNWDFRNEIMNANIGVVFFDEVHATAGPIKFAQASRWIVSKRVYGLSATPIRGDEFDKIISWVIGDVIYTDERPMLPVYLWFKNIDIPIPMKQMNYWQHLKFFMIKYLTWWCKTDKYRDEVVDILYKLILRGKKILAVGAYKDILERTLVDIQSKLSKENMNPNQVIMVHGTSEDKIIDIDMNKISLIISTNKYFSDGLSISELDTLVYLTPGSAKSETNIPQLVGRIVRTHRNKTYALVCDLFNELAPWEKARKNKRIEKYKEFGYHIIEAKDIDEFEGRVKSIQNCIL